MSYGVEMHIRLGKRKFGIRTLMRALIIDLDMTCLLYARYAHDVKLGYGIILNRWDKSTHHALYEQLRQEASRIDGQVLFIWKLLCPHSNIRTQTKYSHIQACHTSAFSLTTQGSQIESIVVSLHSLEVEGQMSDSVVSHPTSLPASISSLF